MAVTALVLTLLSGCGGSGGGGNSNPGGGGGGGANLSGENLEFAAATSDLKATVAGSAGPYVVLQTVQSTTATPALSRASRTPTFLSFLNLYVDTVVSAGKITLNYSPTANGGSTAGQVVVTSADNKTFHATGTIKGSLPMTLDVTIVLTGTKGANTMNGSVTLTGQNITFAMKNLSADDNGNIGSTGEMDVNYGTAVQTVFKNLSGKATGDINGNAVVTSSGKTFSGTGTINLPNGSVKLNLTTPNGTDPLTALLVATLNSEMTFTDGKKIDVSNLLNFDLSKLTGSTGGLPTGTGTGTASYLAPVAIQAPAGATSVYIWQAIGNGQMVGQATLDNGASKAYYWDSPTGAATPLPVPADATRSVAYGIANTGSKRIIVGSYTFNDGFTHACMWTSSSTTGATNFNAPTAFPIDSSLYPIGGTAHAISLNGNYVVGQVTKGTVEVPVVFTADRVFELPMGSLAGTSYEATGVSNTGNVLGGQNVQFSPVVWQDVKISGSSITASRQPLLNTTGSNIPGTEAFHMGPDGTVAGAQGDGKAVYWDKTGYVAHVLNSGTASAVAYAVSDDGKRFAGLMNPSSSGIDLAYWSSLTGDVTDVSASLPTSSFSQIGADFLLADGSFVAIAQKSGSTAISFVYVKKK